VGQILTDKDGPYLELMAGGYSDNQPDYSWVQPGETKVVEQWSTRCGVWTGSNTRIATAR